MAKFKKGDMVILIDAKPEHTYSIGYDYEVLGYRYGRVVIFNPNDLNKNLSNPYLDGAWGAKENKLKLKKPPQEKSTWEEVEHIIGWTPHKTKEAES